MKRFSNRIALSASVLIASVLLLGFTGLTLGWFKKSDSRIVQDTAKEYDFKDTTYFAIMPSDIAYLSAPQTAKERIVNSSKERVICGLTEMQFTKIVNLSVSTTKTTKNDTKNLLFVNIKDGARPQDIQSILGTKKYGTAKCKNINDNKFFFFISPTAVSIERTYSHESVV
jgi:hypothetical protein